MIHIIKYNNYYNYKSTHKIKFPKPLVPIKPLELQHLLEKTLQFFEKDVFFEAD